MTRNSSHPAASQGHIHSFALLSLLLHVGAVSAQTPEQLYSQGKAAFEGNNYLMASKYLFAFKQSAPADVARDILKELDTAIIFSDEQIDLALRTKKQLDTYGHVTQVVSKGKFDDPKSKGVTHSVTLPSSSSGRKPALPAQPPIRGTRVRPADLPVVQPLPVHPPVSPALAEENAKLRNENEGLRSKVEAARKEMQRLRKKLEEATQSPEKSPPK